MNGFEANVRPILVLGVGNILRTDDGVGVHVVETMRTQTIDDDVEIVDGGTAGLDLLAVIDSRRAVVVIDAVDGSERAGTIYRFTPEEITGRSLRLDSLHQVGLLETLQMARLVGRGPARTVIIGVQPETVDWGLTLSPVVAGHVPKVIDQVKKEIETARGELQSLGA